ncbi:hypothetical protein EJ05DRAFT_499771 [Pseudovirgaria hyperparasitica]|uniref:Uncharacterized protein n=1 Tax=Pseudovirgaria hyperparasitica TaxID=470096 RepID=A0A6A6WCQ6_9PEZI|nr:uncharacterized protein EJ05DRAFT_499771 [Pseudovirgaria hyperparasitica]KAF2759357.1 hypothetical protein EJ05DRAFT_499771 [Pseudovirgaria hyperparasitica]
MQFYTSSLILAASVSLISATPTPSYFNKRQGVCLFADVISPNSAKTGQEEGTAGIKAGQAASATDENNFINFCTGSLITNGLQANGGSCNPIPMGRIPSVENMISAIITEPAHNAEVPANTDFTVSVQTRGLDAGAFTNPDVTYYSAPQDLNNNGQIIGHCHITISRLGESADDQQGLTTPPDPIKGDPNASSVAFFKGIDDAGNGQGLLSALVGGGLRPGFYRVCTMISARNHQPVMMPVAQRGAQDDCTKFTVVDNGTPAVDPAQDEADDAESGVVTPAGDAPIGDAPANGEQPAAPVEAAPLPEVVAPAPGENPVETPAEEAPPVEQQPQLADITEAVIDMVAGLGGAGEQIRMSSGVLGGQAPFIVDSGDAANPFMVNSIMFSNAQEAVVRSCRIQYRTCKAMAQAGALQGGNIDDCREQRRNCGAEPQDIAKAVQAKK